MRAGELVQEFTYPTDQELKEKPELAIGVLEDAIIVRCFDVRRSGEGAEPLKELVKVLWDWVYRGEPLARKAGLKLAIQQANLWDLNLALRRIRRKGRPIKSRHTAIKALFRKIYLNKSWEEVTRRLCQCGEPHDDQLMLKKCQANVESEVRHLKRVLKKYDIAFPPARLKKRQPVHKASESLQSKPQGLPKIATLEESSGAGKVDTYAIQHPSIAILLDGSPLPEIPMNSDESDALSLFNPWEPGWVPLWFDEIRTEPIGTRKEIQQRRYDWFDKTFKHFAGSDWQRKGSLDSQREVIARTLLQMYRAARDETLPPEVDEL